MSLAKYLCSGALFCALGVGGTLLTVKGCGEVKEVAPPLPTVADSAAGDSRNYIQGLADEAAVTKANASKFTDWTAFHEDWMRRNIARHKEAFGPYADALNARIGGVQDKTTKKWTFGPYDPKVAAEAAGEAEEGYRRALR